MFTLGPDMRGGGGVERFGAGTLIGGGWEMGTLTPEEADTCDLKGGEVKGGGPEGGKAPMDVIGGCMDGLKPCCGAMLMGIGICVANDDAGRELYTPVRSLLL